MTKERSQVDFPMWRKKVDKSIFDYGSTPIPAWVSKMWNLHTAFKKAESLRSEESIVQIEFKRTKFSGNVVKKIKGRTTPNFYFQHGH